MIRALARGKVYAQRSLGYVQLISAAMMLDLWLKAKGVPHAYYWPALFVAGGLLLLWGFIEDRIGMFEAETEYNWSRAPQLKRIIAALDESEEAVSG